MKKLTQRLLIFFLGLPVLIVVVLFVPGRNHLLLNLLVVLFSALGALEFQNMLKQKDLVIQVPEAAILGGLIPAIACAVVSFNFSRLGSYSVFMLASSWLIVSRIFSAKDQDSFINRTAAGFYVMIYPGIFLAWIVAMSLFTEPGITIVVFLLMVFLNDSAAWAAGMLFGKGNRGIIPASPNKSIAGFIVGILASVAVGFGGVMLLPDVFKPLRLAEIPAGILLGLCTGIAATLGDLGESVLKRSAGIKDSGGIIPGRGGILDSIDSVALAAPVFYLVFRLLFIS